MYELSWNESADDMSGVSRWGRAEFSLYGNVMKGSTMQAEESEGSRVILVLCCLR